MPHTFERDFRIRAYECDPYGHVNNANYLRFMQETAIDASADAGFSPERYRAIGRVWLIRETEIEYLVPLKYGDRVRVKTWVDDFRRVRSRRMYEFRSLDSGELAARASSDWIYLDVETERPVQVTQDLMDAFFPEGPPPQAPRREPFPAPAPPAEVFCFERPVEWRDLDGQGHMNNANYLSLMEEAGVRIASHLDWSMQRQLAAGFVIVARKHRIEYMQPAMLGETLEVSTWLYGVRRTAVNRYYEVRRQGQDDLLARASTLWVWVDLETRRPMRVPEEIIGAFRGNISEGARIP